jgi:hypothetical protein
MAVEQRSFRSYDHHCIEERRAAEFSVDFIDPDDDRHLVPRRGVLKRLQISALEIDGIRTKPCVDLRR